LKLIAVAVARIVKTVILKAMKVALLGHQKKRKFNSYFTKEIAFVFLSTEKPHFLMILLNYQKARLKAQSAFWP